MRQAFVTWRPAAGGAGPGRTHQDREGTALHDPREVALSPALDVGKDEHHAVASTPAGKKVHHRAPPDSEPRPRALLDKPTAKHGTIPVVAHQPASIGALALTAARDAGARVAYLPGLSMRPIAHLYPGQAKTDARDAHAIAHAARTTPHLLRDLKADDETRAARTGRRPAEEIFAALAQQSVVLPGTDAAKTILPALAASLRCTLEQRKPLHGEIEALLQAHPPSPAPDLDARHRDQDRRPHPGRARRHDRVPHPRPPGPLPATRPRHPPLGHPHPRQAPRPGRKQAPQTRPLPIRVRRPARPDPPRPPRPHDRRRQTPQPSPHMPRPPPPRRPVPNDQKRDTPHTTPRTHHLTNNTEARPPVAASAPRANRKTLMMTGGDGCGVVAVPAPQRSEEPTPAQRGRPDPNTGEAEASRSDTRVRGRTGGLRVVRRRMSEPTDHQKSGDA